MNKVSLYVYYDENYGTSWVGHDKAREIVEYLKNYQFKEVDAKRLSKVMSDAVQRGLAARETVVVFSLDVVPDTVVDNPSSPSSNSLFRKFLNVGNTIIWIGDIPLCYVGTPERKITLGNQAQQAVLGLNPNVSTLPEPGKLVRLTLHGLLFGLPSWQGIRPTQRPTSTPPYFINLAFSLPEQQIHAYIATYIPGEALSGFIRIYDFNIGKLRKLDEALLEGIVNIAFRNPLRFLRQRIDQLSIRIEALKSELDSLGPKLDEILSILKSQQQR